MSAEVTRDQVEKAAATILAVAEAIRELGSVPAGVLCARTMGHLSHQQFEHVVNVLVGAKLIRREPTHLLVWIGPQKA